MKKILLLFVVAAFMQALHSQDKFCDPLIADEVNNYKMSDGAKFLKDFCVHLSQWTDKATEQRYTILLRNETKYRIVAKNSPKFQGKMKIGLYTYPNKVISEITTDNKTKIYDFTLKKEGAYILKITYPDGKEGCGALAIFCVGCN
jgi:hypothetical protein